MFFASREFRIHIKRASCVRKYSKTFENIRKRSKNSVKRLKIFENIQKYSNLLSPPCANGRAGKIHSWYGSFDSASGLAQDFRFASACAFGRAGD